MEKIICPKCGSVDNFYTELKANNNVAKCASCDSFIKNIPYAKPTFYIGKYKGRTVESIEDMGYLKWALENMKSLNTITKEAIRNRITQFEYLAK